MAFRVLTDLDSLLDTRQGVLDELLEPYGETFDGVYADTYFNRILDKFDREPFGINSDSYRAAFKQRSINTILKARPTRLLRSLFNVLMDAESLTGKPIRVETVEITVITHPFELPDDVLEEIAKLLEGKLGYHCKVRFTDTKPEQVTGPYLSNFTHVMMYHLFGEWYHNVGPTFAERPSPETKLFLPAVFLKEPDEIGITPTAQIQRLSLLYATLFTLVPLPLSAFNALTVEEMRNMESKL